MIKLALLLLFLPCAFVAWLEHRAFVRFADWYYRLAWVPLSIDGELPKLDPSSFMRHAAEEPTLVVQQQGESLLVRTRPRSEKVPLLGEVELVPTLFFSVRFEQDAHGTWHFFARWAPGHQLFAAAVLVNAAVLVFAFSGANEMMLAVLGGLLLVGVVALGLTVLRYRGAARDVLGGLQTAIYLRAFE